MTKQEKHSVTATREVAAPPRTAKPVVAHVASPPAGKIPPLVPIKRKAAEEDNGVDNEEHPVQVKVNFNPKDTMRHFSQNIISGTGHPHLRPESWTDTSQAAH
jgi:hypothetical protein